MNTHDARTTAPRRRTGPRTAPPPPRLTHMIRTASMGLYAIHEPRPESLALHRRWVPAVEAPAAE